MQEVEQCVRQLIIDARPRQVGAIQRFKELQNGIFAEIGFKYAVIGGTLLGAIRDGGFIPYDDDIDICADPEEIDRLLLAVEGYALHMVKNHIGNNYWLCGIDIFPSNHELVRLHKLSIDKWIPFDSITVPIPRGAISFLNRLYGPTWPDEYRVWNHKYNDQWGDNFDPMLCVLTKDDIHQICLTIDQ